LNKKEYIVIEGTYKKRKMNEEIKFFTNFRIFQSLSKSKMQKILLLMELRTFTRGKVIFKEGDPVNGIYFIK